LWAFSTSGNPNFHIEGAGYCSKQTGISPVGKRKVFALSCQEIFDYLELSSGDTMTQKSVFKMFWNDEKPHDAQSRFWLSSAYKGNYIKALFVDSLNGCVDFDNNDSSCCVRPALVLDLSKIDFTIEGGNN